MDFLDNIVNRLSTKNVNMNRRRVINASPAVDSHDYIIKADLDAAIAALPQQRSWQWPTRQSDLSLVRVLGTIYRNTLDRPMIVGITVSLDKLEQVAAYVDTVTPPQIPVGNVYATSAAATIQINAMMTFVVLPQYYYQIKSIAAGIPTMASWIEWD